MDKDSADEVSVRAAGQGASRRRQGVARQPLIAEGGDPSLNGIPRPRFAKASVKRLVKRAFSVTNKLPCAQRNEAAEAPRRRLGTKKHVESCPSKHLGAEHRSATPTRRGSTLARLLQQNPRSVGRWLACVSGSTNSTALERCAPRIMGVQVGQARRLALPDRSVQASQGGGNRQRGEATCSQQSKRAHRRAPGSPAFVVVFGHRSQGCPRRSCWPPPAGSRCEGTRRPRLGSWCRGAEPHERDNIDGMEG